MDTGNEDYNSPYGDLQDSQRSQHSTFAYEDRENNDDAAASATVNDEESRGLIKTDSESDLAMAVVDILSCCDGESTQAKLLRQMSSKYQKNGNLVPGEDEEEQEQFADEDVPKKKGPLRVFKMMQKKKPNKLLREFGDDGVGKKYRVRSSRGIGIVSAGQLPLGMDTLCTQKDSITKERSWKLVLLLVAGILVLAGSVVLVMTKLNRSLKGPHSYYEDYGLNMAPMTTDCSEVSKQAHPHVLSQCVCQGSITEISDDAKEKYNTFLLAYGAEYLHANETISSCSSRNQALVWLSEDEGSFPSVQRHVLVLFFIKLNGLYWTLQDGIQEWLTPDHECTWFGITCNDKDEVTAINLWNLNLEGSIPKEIMSLTSLKTLSLPENKIRGHLPTDAFIMLPKLTDLTLFMNSISGPLDGRILDVVTQLRTLNVDSNDMTGTLPTQLGKLTALEELKMARNDLKGSIPTELGNVKMLQKIELEENNLDGTLPSEMGKLLLLKSLNLSWNDLQGTIPWEFMHFRGLVDLFLTSNNLSGTLSPGFKLMDNLENLVVSFNSLTGALPSGMEHMVSLSTVHLDNNRFNGTIPSELGECSMLRDLKLEFNDFHGRLPTELGRLNWLITLSLEGNSFSGVMPQEVCSLRGDVGTLETLSATCTDSSGKEKELFVSPNEFPCSVPDCCTTCHPKA